MGIISTIKEKIMGDEVSEELAIPGLDDLGTELAEDNSNISDVIDQGVHEALVAPELSDHDKAVKKYHSAAGENHAAKVERKKHLNDDVLGKPVELPEVDPGDSPDPPPAEVE